jgi:hypothetical protein
MQTSAPIVLLYGENMKSKYQKSRDLFDAIMAEAEGISIEEYRENRKAGFGWLGSSGPFKDDPTATMLAEPSPFDEVDREDVHPDEMPSADNLRPKPKPRKKE